MKKNVSLERLKEVLNYNPETGVFTWRYCENALKEWNTCYAGKIAGTNMLTGYTAICIDNRRYLAHRLAWFYMEGEWPPHQVDHINMQRADNRLSNLRLATHAQNKWNRGANKNNKTGHKGVRFHKHSGLWQARVYRGKEISLGYFPTMEEAIIAYKERVALMDGDFFRK